MSAALFIFFGVFALPLLIMAIFLLNGKGAFLIAGYNTMSKEEQSTFDEKALCRFVGGILIAITVGLLLFPLGIYLDLAWILYCGIAIILFGSFGAAIYTNTSKRFRVGPHSYSPASTKTIIVIAALSIIVLIAIGALLYQGGKDPVVNIHDNRIEIKAMYGLNINFTDITNISLIEKSMKDIGIGSRTNGYGGMGEALKGHFMSNSLGQTLLFVQSTSSPTIRIVRDNGNDIYMSFRDGAKTQQLYQELTAVAK